MSKDPDLVRHEDEIVWTEDVDRLDYVREHLDLFATSRQGPVGWRGSGRRVGYATLREDAPEDGGRFARRVFWVKDSDRSEVPEGVYRTGAPAEAVDPRTVTPGIWGELTDRAWGAPLPPPAEQPGAGEALAVGPFVVPVRNGQLMVGESLSTGRAQVYVGPAEKDQIEVFLDCASGSQFGDGTHVMTETLPRGEAAELLISTVMSTPWLLRALALSVVEQWLDHGTGGSA